VKLLPILSPSEASPASDKGPAGEPLARVGERPVEGPLQKRVYFEVFGCQMNKLDAELMLAVLMEAGYEPVGSPSEAGVILFNTCAVREHAEHRVFSRVGRLKPLKRKRPDLVIGVLGCSAQRQGEDIFRRHPHVGIVCGTGEFLRLPELIEEARKKGRATALDLNATPRFTRKANLGPSPFQAYLSVLRGCDQACTFCVVPATRGKEVSRPVREIVDEARALVDGGVREITLLGQTVNSYGKRLAKGHKIGLHHVLHELDKIPGLERIRFITSHPRFLSAELIDAMASLEKVCEYLHLPAQSGSNSVLERMLRTYTVEHYKTVVGQCRERVPGLALATDIIVGFCGETDEEFQATVRLLEDVRFESGFVFKYSERTGTRAAELLSDDVPEDVKRERHRVVLDLLDKLSLEAHRARVGQVEEVLVEGTSRLDKRRLTGRNRANQIVVFPADPGSEDTGKLVPVRIADATPLVLIGEKAGPGR
jgi:tRNA-2-methylthio-N6-dimethylallyladenosine synthase